MNVMSAEMTKRLRGVVLELIFENHGAQKSRLDDLTLWGVLDRLKHDVSRNDVRTLLQDLHDRGYVRFDQQRDVETGAVRISKIEITPDGRDLVEGTIVSPAVQLR